MGKLKNNKAPGPGEVPPELIKWLDSESRNVILELLNDCWNKESLTKDTNDAKLTIIYKTGCTHLPQNYRPIALLHVIYKLLASIIQKRIRSKMDGGLHKHRFGFIKRRGISQSLLILRRTQEISEEAALESHLLLRTRLGKGIR